MALGYLCIYFWQFLAIYENILKIYTILLIYCYIKFSPYNIVNIGTGSYTRCGSYLLDWRSESQLDVAVDRWHSNEYGTDVLGQGKLSLFFL